MGIERSKANINIWAGDGDVVTAAIGEKALAKADGILARSPKLDLVDYVPSSESLDKQYQIIPGVVTAAEQIIAGNVVAEVVGREKFPAIDAPGFEDTVMEPLDASYQGEEEPEPGITGKSLDKVGRNAFTPGPNRDPRTKAANDDGFFSRVKDYFRG